MPMTQFSPRRHGFHFPNDFVNPVVTIPGVGTVTTSGLCGGMTFSSLDYFHASMPVPTHVPGDFPASSTVPPPGTRLYQQIYDRQLNTFDPVANPDIVKFVTMRLPFGRTAYQASVQDEWPRVTAAIDGGRPGALGLLADSANPADSHQVVVIGYEPSPRQLHISDSNHPDVLVTLTLDDAAGRLHASTGEDWIGFFLQTYTQAAPGYQDLVLGGGLWTNPAAPATAALGDPVEAGFLVRNAGDHPAHPAALDVSVTGPAGEDWDAAFPIDGAGGALPPAADRRYFSPTVASLGTSAGTYEFVAWFQTTLGEWFPVPAGTAGTTTTATLDLT